MRQPTPDVLGNLLGNLKHTMIDIADIRTDGGTQMRAGLNAETVEEYRQWLDELARRQNGLLEMPPVIVYFDGETYWLADGFHRLEAWKQHGSLPKAVHADLRSGTRRDAVLHAAGANANHGLRRTNADKRRSVEVLLRDEEWAKWSDGEIARKCMVSQNFVSTMRRELTQIGFESPTERKGADGRVINTSNIGAKDQPTYVQIWQLNNAVDAYVKGVRPGSIGDQIDLAKTLPWTIGGDEWKAMTETLPKPWRVGDVKQACNNVADQLRQDLKRRSTTPPVVAPIPLQMATKSAPLPGGTTTNGDSGRVDPVDHTATADDGRPVDIPSNLAAAGWKAVKRGQLFSASNVRGDRIGGHASFNNLCDEMYRIQREHNAATVVDTAIPAGEGLPIVAAGVPVPVRYVVDALLWDTASNACSASELTHGKIRKPFFYDGMLWTCIGASYSGVDPENNGADCLRVHAPGQQIEPGEYYYDSAPGYKAGTPVQHGGMHWVLGAQWMRVRRGPVEALTVTPDVPAGKTMMDVFLTANEQSVIDAERDQVARELAADEAARQYMPTAAIVTVDDTAGSIAVDSDALERTVTADDATRAGIAVIDGTAVAVMTEHLRTAAAALAMARVWIPFDSEWHGAVGVLIDDIRRIEKEIRQ